MKKAGLRVDLLLPKEEVPLGRILGSISSRGTLYAVVLHPQNHEHRSLTLNILQGVHQGSYFNFNLYYKNSNLDKIFINKVAILIYNNIITKSNLI